MASISKLSNPTPASSFSSTFSPRTPQPKCLIRLLATPAATFNSKLSSSKLSVRTKPSLRGSLVVRCSQSDGNGNPVKRTYLHDLYEKEGHSPWYDNLCRPVTDLLPLIASGVRGVTSNPAIFQKAISTSNAYNDQFRELVQSGKDIESAYWELVVKDIQDACKLFEAIYDQTDAGAKKQRLLWASTSVKNPAYPDTLYVAPLIGPDTVSTMPDQALQAFVDHGTVSRTIDSNVSEAEGIYSALEKLGIDWSYVGNQLELEGVDSFKKSFDSLLDTLQEKANSLKLVSL
ncbi:hypothetical protein C1H46_035027 [Malus baccata]|uniref:Uncharacterized protein n=1 Tax=Malus baccata TaxID=106549 RepID=A0A540KYZ3_MALBA|nr:hypothetical protein C1H46_035027 [Malus baccata]